MYLWTLDDLPQVTTISVPVQLLGTSWMSRREKLSFSLLPLCLSNWERLVEFKAKGSCGTRGFHFQNVLSLFLWMPEVLSSYLCLGEAWRK